MRVGDWVEVRSEAEILQTLDQEGRLDGMPFMPEMLQFCGQRLRIYKCAHKTCDGISRQSRRLTKMVHLETRCSGEMHGGCQAACLLFWREEWLRPASAPGLHAGGSRENQFGFNDSACSSVTKNALTAYAVVEDDGLRYRCQATQIRAASTRLPWWDVRQYVEDLRSGNVYLWRFASGMLRASWMAMGRGEFAASHLVRWLYDHLRFLWNGEEFPVRVGRIPRGKRTPAPSHSLNLQPGEVVRVRSLAEIDETLDTWGQNRGLYFDPEQAPYANGVFRVRDSVTRMINEETGRMIELKTPSVLLESVFCQGRHSSCRMFCPRSAPLLWRELWLERISENDLSHNEVMPVLRETSEPESVYSR